MSIWSFLVGQVQHNQFVSAALIAAPATALTYSIRSLPVKAYRAAKRMVSIDVRFNSDMPDYLAVQRFVTKNIVWDKLSRNYTYQSESKFDWEDYRDEVKHHGLTSGYGIHLGVYRNRLVIVDRYLDENSNSEKFKEHLALTFITRSKQVVNEFAREIGIAAGTNVDEFTHVPIYINSGSHWNRAGKLPLRGMDTVFTADDAGNKILQAMRDFEAKRDDHHRKGLPHHLGVLLYGEPGCGKSSLIHAIASALGRSIRYLNLGSVKDDKELLDLMSNIGDCSKVLLVAEDFDAAGASTDRREPAMQEITCAVSGETAMVPDDKPASAAPRKPVTLSALLNVFDGLISPDGLITLATTNHPDNIDPALRRAGRFDQAVELGRLGKEDFERMCDLFEVDPASYNVDGLLPMTGAEMRATILNPIKMAA